MSHTLILFAKSFINERLTMLEFSGAYQELWRIERDTGVLKCDENELSELISEIFILVDLFSEHENRKDYELDEQSLREKIASVIDSYEKRIGSENGH